MVTPNEIVAFIDEWNPRAAELAESKTAKVYVEKKGDQDFVEKLLFHTERLNFDAVVFQQDGDRLVLEEAIALCNSVLDSWKAGRSERTIAGAGNLARDNPIIIIRRVLSQVTAVAAQVASNEFELVFISHASVDLQLAERLAKEIKYRLPGTETFISSRLGDIRPKDEWFDKIKAKLRKADAYVTIVTPASKERPWVLWEHGVAWASERPLITTRIGVGNSEIPEPFKILQIHALDHVEAAAEVFKDLGADGSDLEAFCEDMTAIQEGIPQPEGRPAPIELRWGTCTTNGWNEAKGSLHVNLRSDPPVEVREIEAVMWHREAPDQVYPAMQQSLLQVPITLGIGQETFSQALRFNTSRIPDELQNGGTAANQVHLRAKVTYRDANGHMSTLTSPIHDV